MIPATFIPALANERGDFQMSWRFVLLLTLAGAAGTWARFGLSTLVTRLAGDSFPWGTSVVNVVGCAVFGLVWGMVETKVAPAMRPETKAVALTGFLGAFTTFSTFAFETQRQLAQGQTGLALASVAGQVVLGIAAVACGLALARMAS